MPPAPTITDATSADAFARYRPLVDDWAAFAAALARPLPQCVWTNTLRATPAQVAAWLAAEGLAATPLPWYPGAFRLPAGAGLAIRLPNIAGAYHIQEEVSLLPALLLGAQPGERILDLCAAPGGKTAQIAVMMQNRGTVLANDRSSMRMHVLRSTLNRLGLINVSTTIHDATNYPGGPAFDRVLADVPCTCEGTSRKHPSAPLQGGAVTSAAISTIQRLILKKAVQRCRVGGRIVYATCTYAPEENEAVVDAVLREHEGQLDVLPMPQVGLVGAPGITQWDGRLFHPALRHARRIWPHQHDTGGFFVAVLHKHG